MNLYKGIAEFYDLEDSEYQMDDLPFYKRYAEIVNDDILELGCGTGRVSIFLARNGFKVTGIDLSDDMLDIFKNKLVEQKDLLEKIRIVKGDISSFSLKQKYGLIIAPGRSFQGLVHRDKIVNSLLCIKKHLKRSGLLIIDVFQPDVFLDERYCYNEMMVYNKKLGDKRVKMTYKCQSINRQEKIVYSTYSFDIENKDGFIEHVVDNNQLKYYSYEELISLLERNKFIIKEYYGWYDMSPLEKNREILIVASLK